MTLWQVINAKERSNVAGSHVTGMAERYRRSWQCMAAEISSILRGMTELDLVMEDSLQGYTEGFHMVS